MSDGPQIGAAPPPAPSTLARVAYDLGDSRARMDSAATDLEGLADRLCGPSLAKEPGAGSGAAIAADQPSGSVNVLDVLATGLSLPAARIEAAIARIRAAIG